MTTPQPLSNLRININTTNFTFTVLHNKTQNHQEEEEESSKNKKMFYSHNLLSSKGPLGNIWVAGYFFKRLKKRQVTDTHIPSSVDKILLEGLPSVTYRILAYLLLGVVRIYSKKVEYLFQDCSETVCDINRFSVGKKTVPLRDIVRSSCSISLPERYELDAFQLEVADDTNRGHISKKEDIILQDAEKSMSSLYSLDKQRFEEVFLHCEELDVAQTSAGVCAEQETFSYTQTPEKQASDRETCTFTHTPPDNVVSPHGMEVDEEISSPNHMKDFEKTKEKLRDLKFTQDVGMDIDMICELDDELINLVNGYKNTVGGNKDAQEEPLNYDHDNLKDNDVQCPSSMEKTHCSEITDPAAAATPEFVAVPTPTKKENLQRPGKRKCVFDVITALDNDSMKKSIKDASDLVCKRRKAPRTVIDLWRFHRIPTLSKSFLEPLLPCATVEPGYINCSKKTVERTIIDPEAEPVETAQVAAEPDGTSQVAAEPVEMSQVPGKLMVAVSPRTPTDSRSGIAPGTPVQCPTVTRVFEGARAADSDGEGAQSYHNVRKEFSVAENEHPGPRLMDEIDDANEGDSQELDKNNSESTYHNTMLTRVGKNGWSARTRSVAMCLHSVFEKKKQQGEESVALLPIVERKTRRENARFFFEILVLSTGGLVNVMQPQAFGDVLLHETPKLEAIVHNCR